MRQMWTTGRGTLAGKHYQVDGALNYPLPLQGTSLPGSPSNGIPVWVAGGGERVVLAGIAATEVIAGREAFAGAAHDHDLDRWVDIAGLQGMQQLTTQLVIECVSFLGPIEGKSADAGRGLIDQQHLVAIFTITSCLATLRCEGAGIFAAIHIYAFL